MARARRALAIPAAIGVLILAVVVGATVAAHSGNPTDRTLGMIGDSITNQSRVALHQALKPSYRNSITAYGGATISSMNADGAIAAMAAKNPDIIVFDLGTNDLVRVVVNPTTYPLSAFEADYAAMRARFTGCVVVTTINSHRIAGGALMTVPKGLTIYNNDAKQFNGWLKSHYGRVADWNALATSWWHSGTQMTYLQLDGVHPTAKGQVQLSLIVRQQADRC